VQKLKLHDDKTSPGFGEDNVQELRSRVSERANRWRQPIEEKIDVSNSRKKDFRQRKCLPPFSSLAQPS
jgi:hypothetical protein